MPSMPATDAAKRRSQPSALANPARVPAGCITYRAIQPEDAGEPFRSGPRIADGVLE